MKLILLTKSTFFVEEDKIISTLFEEGLDNLHLYKPGTEPIYSERLLTLLSDDYYNKITVHDFYYLKEEYQLRGIHIDSADKQLPLRYKGHVSRTCDRIDQLKEAKKSSDYVFLRNTFGNIHLQEPATSTIEELKAAAHQGLIDKKVYALGGINIDTIRMAKDLGFGGVVVCSDVWNRFDIHQELNYKELIQHFDRLKKAVR